MQYLKGGFSYRAKRELNANLVIWQRGFSDHRIRDAADYRHHRQYLLLNPVRQCLCEDPSEYPYSSARESFELDQVPQRLKPSDLGEHHGTAEAVPFQANPAEKR